MMAEATEWYEMTHLTNNINMQDVLDGVTNIRDRRRIQNRLSQRKRREKLRSLSVNSDSRPLPNKMEFEKKSLSSLARTLRAALDMQMQMHDQQEWSAAKDNDLLSMESLLADIECLNAASPPSGVDSHNDNNSMEGAPRGAAVRRTSQSQTNPGMHINNNQTHSHNHDHNATVSDLQNFSTPIDTIHLSNMESAFNTGLQNTLVATRHQLQHIATNMGDGTSLQGQDDAPSRNEKRGSPVSFSTSQSAEYCSSAKGSSSATSSGSTWAKPSSDRWPAGITPPERLLLKVDEIIAQLVSLYKFATDLELMQEHPGLLDLIDVVQAKFHNLSSSDSSASYLG